ncbi:hypothetical protein A1Q1_08106 [Trichosporon asahii var. asahii CBS 2479]|uniref:Uncharacterized protein n=1 Tax=Trichosporon asahii var. asahii (strain ATCC 90039 / CBS 2479 / JCM 2466 / KCTC 7840 / NBRC 103889/ NCYC 2677 / UAMH 7654) TaxID=1186058 RepID=J5R570_TRIAS|nr:hypothetical protein A1Q1_08106 [Trichosporon asahii var. asahii CBS 2479]EJT50763.1 hypothetical protein A1Q1_08106 [Trichosporon asahii var. asahii CBS 2479]
MLARHKQSVVVDLKQPAGVALVKKLAERADVLIDPFRPGVLEKLGLGPKPLLEANPKLIYARMTGFRRDGKYSAMAGHDINYLAVSGVLSMLGRAGDKPHPPLLERHRSSATVWTISTWATSSSPSRSIGARRRETTPSGTEGPCDQVYASRITNSSRYVVQGVSLPMLMRGKRS